VADANRAAQRKRFGGTLAEALSARGRRQEDLAEALDTTQSAVSAWINGKSEPAAATVFACENRQPVRRSAGSAAPSNTIESGRARPERISAVPGRSHRRRGRGDCVRADALYRQSGVGELNHP
jgi:transcriptional regulator with XRE-family HTH domain